MGSKANINGISGLAEVCGILLFRYFASTVPSNGFFFIEIPILEVKQVMTTKVVGIQRIWSR